MREWSHLDTYAIANLCILSICEFSNLHRVLAAYPQNVTESIKESVSSVQILDTYAQFRTWVDDVGALQEEDASLDRRIHHLDIYNEVFRLLKELFMTLQKCIVMRLYC